MEGIVPVRGDHAVAPPATWASPAPNHGRPAAVGVASAHPVNPAAVKAPSDYLRAIRRRVWLVLVVALPLAIASSIWALRQPRIYQAVAEVTIDPPQLDPILTTLVSREIGRHDTHTQESYIPNLIALLRSKTLAELVVSNPAFAAEINQFDDPAFELILDRLQVRPVLKSNRIVVSLEGKDPARAKKLLETLLYEFKDQAERSNREKIQETKDYAVQRLDEMKKQLTAIDGEIMTYHEKERTIGPSGRNIFEEQYVDFSNLLAHKQMKVDELNQQLMLAQSFPKADLGGARSDREQRIAMLKRDKARLLQGLERIKRTARRFDADPAARDISLRLQEILDELDELGSIRTQIPRDPTTMLLENAHRELEDTRGQYEAALERMQASMPAYQKYLSRLEERTRIRQAITEMEHNLRGFEVLTITKSQRDSVKIPDSVIEPVVPIRPSRVTYIGMGLVMSLGLALGLVFFLEHVDHSVKVPEHVTQGLTLPLLGVVPRIRRTAQTHRAGHLWTPGSPDSLEADAFRNVRASLLGVSDRLGPIVTLLVTSPKAGDGKSTAALNLAATCARAGERTLLLDVDLRRPSLGGVFPAEPDKPSTVLGLVDVLRGDVPWQATLRHTELRNLDFIPTGDPRDIPIEILGTLELRQLLAALRNHYDRVILDGPAVLGMADCRMLGRMVDAAILVVRSGAHQFMTLQRTRAMMEQSRVSLAGVVVNNLSDDVHNWSSYGYGADSALSAPAGRIPRDGRGGRALGADVRDEGLVMAGTGAA
ncbi:MAG: polysaccharide biosynthesis tyrosine autokinase [Isosphaeraceae bacterium]